MFKKLWRTYCHFLLIAGAVLLLVMASLHNHQALNAVPVQYTFRGEYSQNGGPWLPLNEQVKLSALEGNLALRGNFGCEIPENEIISFYMDHLQFCVVMDGEILAMSQAWDQWLQPSMCGRQWYQIISPGIGENDVVEIYMRNPHGAGNAGAYVDFLNSLYAADRAALQDMLGRTYLAHRVVGMLALGISFAVLGIALAFILMNIREGKSIWTLGLLSFCMGAYIALDTPDVAMVNGLTTFNTYASALAVMMASLEMSIFLGIFLHGASRKFSRGIMFAHCIVMALILMISLTGRVGINDVFIWWMRFQILISPLQIFCAVREIPAVSRPRANLLTSCTVLIAASLIELLNETFFWWNDFSVAKLAFVLLFMLHIVKGIRGIPAIHQKARRAEQLQTDLKDSQITMAMSQIRTHFVFNVLNAISGMCKYDPEKADMTVVRFSRYLRTNIDIMSNNEPVSFETALRYLEDYVVLEQIRFGDKVEFEAQIGVEDFQIPPLVLQPLVENAIKHGLTPLHDGGTVTLRTWEDEKNIYLAVEDNGIGFQITDLEKDTAVGLKNVQFRLAHMMNGSLKVESTPGVGTAVTITIPIEEARKCM